ncbi:MAG: hypothetical protein IT547_03890 [Hyphomonadaceae bacterium]|nr:hypothetical protein [Hyphomonadaceae bacterium]
MSDTDAPRPRSALEPASFIFALGVVIALLVLAPPSARQSQSEREQIARGYNRIVELFIQRGWLEVTQPNPGAETGAESPYIQLSAAARDIPAVRAFQRRSYLSEDMLNSDIWRVENWQIKSLDASAHTIALPNSLPRTWSGDILFRTSAPTVTVSLLRGTLGEIVLSPPAFDAPMSDATRRRFNVFGANGRVEGTVVRIQEGPGSGLGLPIADLMAWGPTPVVTALDDRFYEVFVDDELVEPETRVAIPPQGVLRIRSKAGGIDQELRLTDYLTSAPEISRTRPWGRERERAPATEEIARAVEHAMDAVIASEARNAQRGDPLPPTDEDLRLTIDGPMQAALQAMIPAYLAENDAYLDNEYDVGVTIMDAVTGDILALGSDQHHPDETTDPRQTREPVLDVNFRPLLVGSAAKPLVTAAILQSRPELGSLVLLEPGTGEQLETLLGVGFRPNNTLGDSNSGPCDFNCYLRTSNNRYAASLMLLATAHNGARPVPTPGAYALSGSVQQTRPLTAYETMTGGRTVFTRATSNVVNMRWHRNLSTLFGIDYESPEEQDEEGEAERCARGQTRLGDDIRNVYIWREVFTLYSLADPCAFGGVTPQRENFRLDRDFEFESDALPVMIGGGDATWTNVTLAQSYTRLVTGAAVEARIFASAPNAPVPPTSIRMRPEARQRLTHALTLVTHSDGTARAFSETSRRLNGVRERLRARNTVLGLFSKTGTPAIPRLIFSADSRALDVLIRLNRLVLDRDGNLAIQAGTRTLAVEQNNQLPVQQALVADPVAYAAIGATGSNVESVIRRLLRENTRYRDEREERFEVFRGRIFRVQRPNEGERMMYGKVFVFVAAVYPGSIAVDASGMALNGDQRPQRAYVVAVNIQGGVVDRDGPGGSLATRLSARIFDELIVPRLTGDQR